MIKVSFIAIFLAAIGYKEYNPSVEGVWQHEGGFLTQVYFEKDSFGFDSVVLGDDRNYHNWKFGTYELTRDTLTLLYFSPKAIEKYKLVRQNKRKLILYPLDDKKTTKLVFMRTY